MKKEELNESEKTNSDKVLALIKQGEGELIEWKDSRILKDAFKLARSISALSNQKGGFVLIGVKDDGIIEGLKFKKEHEEHIMNIASENCSPPIRPHFESVTIPEKGDVYVIKIIRKEKDVFHGVKTRDGLVYFIRVGSTIREIQPHELSRGGKKGMKIAPYAPSEKGLLFLTDKLVTGISARKKWSFKKTIRVLTTIGASFIIGSMTLLLAAIYGKLGIPLTNFPTWAYVVIVIWLASGIFLISASQIASETKCPACGEYFKFKKVESEILGKRTIDEGTEEWKVRNLYRCENCEHEHEETVYEEHGDD
jgi:hypothetical protein